MAIHYANGTTSHHGLVVEFDSLTKTAGVWNEELAKIEFVSLRILRAEVDAPAHIAAAAREYMNTNQIIITFKAQLYRLLTTSTTGVQVEVTRGRKEIHGMRTVVGSPFGKKVIDVNGREVTIPNKYVIYHVDLSTIVGKVACLKCRTVYDSILHPDMSYPRRFLGGDWTTGKVCFRLNRYPGYVGAELCKHCYLKQRSQLPTPDFEWEGPGLVDYDNPMEVEFAKDVLNARSRDDMTTSLMIFADWLNDNEQGERAAAVRESCGRAAVEASGRVKLTIKRINQRTLCVTGFAPFFAEPTKGNVTEIHVSLTTYTQRIRAMRGMPGIVAQCYVPPSLAERISRQVRKFLDEEQKNAISL